MQWSRRDFTKHAFLAGGSAVLGCSTRVQSIAPIASPTYPTLPAPASSGLEHLVVVTMENRSFDHFLGWLLNAAGIQAGLNFTDKSGASHPIHSLSGDFTGCPQSDPDHSYDGSRVAYDGGMMDGFLRAGSNDLFSIGYYEEKDIPFYAALAAITRPATITSPPYLARPFQTGFSCTRARRIALTIASPSVRCRRSWTGSRTRR